LESIFDLPVTRIVEQRFQVDDSFTDGEWNIGMIVGPSGSGKTVIARKLFDSNVHYGWKWDERTVVDNISETCSIQEIIDVFSSVGFSSPPSWLKSYRVLSNGEKFRVDLARCILERKDMFVFDEFSSVVDRDVAKVCAFAVSKALRRYDSKMIALSCHYDVVKWLEPDWVYDLRDFTLHRRRLRRPTTKIRVQQIRREAWSMFRRHHYLSSSHSKAAQCYGAYLWDELVGFCSVIQSVGHKGRKRIHRLVVLPDYQGVGIGLALLNCVAEYYRRQKLRMSITSSHPAVMRGLERKSMWKLTNFYQDGTARHSGKTIKGKSMGMNGRPGHVLSTYEYQGPA